MPVVVSAIAIDASACAEAGQFRSLRRNVGWGAASNLVYGATQGAVLVALAKLGTPSLVGQFAFALALCGPAISLANLHLREVQATDALRIYRFADYFQLRTLTTLLAMVAVLVALVAIRADSATATVALAVLLFRAMEAWADVLYGQLQQRERLDLVGKSVIAKSVTSLVAFVVVFWSTRSLAWGVTGMAAATTMLLLAYDSPNVERALAAGAEKSLVGIGLIGRLLFRTTWHVPAIARLGTLAAPLGLVMALISVSTNMPRYFLERVAGHVALGVFAATASLMLVGNMIVTASGQATGPRLADYFASGRRAAFVGLLLKLTAMATGVGLAGVGVAVFGGSTILRLLFSAEYAQYAHVLVLVMIAAAIWNVGAALGYGMLSVRYFRAQVPLFAVVAIASFVFCRLLIPRFGIEGAGWSCIASMGVQMIGSLLTVLHAIRHAPSGVAGQFGAASGIADPDRA